MARTSPARASTFTFANIEELIVSGLGGDDVFYVLFDLGADDTDR